MKKLFFGLIVSLCIVGVLAGCSSSNQAAPENPQDPSNPPAGMIMGKNALVAMDQKPGDKLVVSLVQLEKPGFVVVEGKVNGLLDVVKVSQLLPEGVSQNLELPLNKQSEHEETYSLYMYFDDGDGLFDRGKDSMARNDMDDLIRVTIHIDKEAEDPGEVVL